MGSNGHTVCINVPYAGSVDIYLFVSKKHRSCQLLYSGHVGQLWLLPCIFLLVPSHMLPTPRHSIYAQIRKLWKNLSAFQNLFNVLISFNTWNLLLFFNLLMSILSSFCFWFDFCKDLTMSYPCCSSCLMSGP